MQEIVDKAQAVANEKQAKVYVFRAVGPNGHEVGWFNTSGKKSALTDELVVVLEPQTAG